MATSVERGAARSGWMRLTQWWLEDVAAPRAALPVALLDPVQRERLRAGQALALFYGACIVMLLLLSLTVVAYPPNGVALAAFLLLFAPCIVLNRRGHSQTSAALFAVVFIALLTAVLHDYKTLGGMSFADVPGLDLMVAPLAAAALVLPRFRMLLITALAFGSGVLLYVSEGPARDVIQVEALLNPGSHPTGVWLTLQYGVDLLSRTFGLFVVVVLAHLIERQTITAMATEVEIERGVAAERREVIALLERQRQIAEAQQRWLTEVLANLTLVLERVDGTTTVLPPLPDATWTADPQLTAQLGFLQIALRRFRDGRAAIQAWAQTRTYWQQLPNDVLTARGAGSLPSPEFVLAANVPAADPDDPQSFYPPAAEALTALRRFALYLVREDESATTAIQEAIGRYGYGEATVRIPDAFQMTRFGPIVTSVNWLFNRMESFARQIQKPAVRPPLEPPALPQTLERHSLPPERSSAAPFGGSGLAAGEAPGHRNAAGTEWANPWREVPDD